jgi:hypothetical protein
VCLYCFCDCLSFNDLIYAGSKRDQLTVYNKRGGSGAVPPKFFFRADIFPSMRTTYFRDISDIFLGPHDIRWFFGTWFFADGFLFPVKELGFWTNPGHWVRVLDAAGSYMYIVL